MAKAAKPRTVDRRNRDADVLEAAIEVFYEKGYSAASIQDVADIVGVLKGSLYHYINSKEDLLFRIFESSHEQALEIMDSVSARNLPPRARLGAYLIEIVSWYLTHVERVSLYFNEWRYLTGDNLEAVRVHRRLFAKYVSDILVEAGDDLRSGLDPKLATNYILGAVNNIPFWYRRSSSYSTSRVASEFAALSTAAVFVDQRR